MAISTLNCSPLKAEAGELLYNGVRLPDIWPPEDMNLNSYDPMPVPYLCNPPRVIPIDVGRQLFVDDFLIEYTNLNREFHKAKKYEGNPVLKPETELEIGTKGQPVSCPKDGGVWWDPVDKIFKMWYEAGWTENFAYATSKDGINWERPDLGIISGTNQILPKIRPDSTTVVLDHDTTNPSERFKKFIRSGGLGRLGRGNVLVSADGIRWSEPIPTGLCGDRSTMFYNPFRKKWVYSIRSSHRVNEHHGRARYYHEHSDFFKGADWKYLEDDAEDTVVFHTGADRLDPPDSVVGQKAQLYNLQAVGYESLMLGFHEIHLGPPNSVCNKIGVPKITELMLSFSRDGFHWHRPNRAAFIPATRKPGDWDRGYVQSVGGICTVVGDQLWFYYSGFMGDTINREAYANGSTGIAVLRRDGFASMSASKDGGTLITRPVTFKGRFLFVNTDCPRGELKVEILNEDNTVIAPFSADNCNAISIDSTIQPVKWKNAKDFSNLAGKKIRFRFYLKNGHLYSFWVSPDEFGASHGYVAGGGPGLTGSKDEVGKMGYNSAQKLQIE